MWFIKDVFDLPMWVFYVELSVYICLGIFIIWRFAIIINNVHKQRMLIDLDGEDDDFDIDHTYSDIEYKPSNCISLEELRKEIGIEDDVIENISFAPLDDDHDVEIYDESYEIKLLRLKVVELREIAKQHKVKNWWNMKKLDLVDAILRKARGPIVSDGFDENYYKLYFNSREVESLRYFSELEIDSEQDINNALEKLIEDSRDEVHRGIIDDENDEPLYNASEPWFAELRGSQTKYYEKKSLEELRAIAKEFKLYSWEEANKEGLVEDIACKIVDRIADGFYDYWEELGLSE